MRKALLIILMGFIACGDVDNTPFGDYSKSELKYSNHYNVRKLIDDSAPLKFALVTDSHQNHTDLESVIGQINRDHFDFVTHLGDYTNMSYWLEIDLFIDIIKKLTKPYFVVIGNHDSIGSGPKMYKLHFGDWDFSFEFKGIRFILFNSNAFEHSLDYDWLEAQIASSTLPVIIFTHIPPDSDAFSKAQVDKNFEIIANPKVQIVFVGHHHHFDTRYFDGKLVQQIGRTEGEHYGTVKIDNGVVTIESCDKGVCVEKVNYTFTYP